MIDNDLTHKHLHAHLKTFFEAQHQAIQQRASQGGPVSDILAALSDIRSALPEVNENTRVEEWIIQAQNTLTKKKAVFRAEHKDEAGWGAATFTELSDSLYLLQLKYR